MQRWVIAALAASLLIIGWQGWSVVKQHRQLKEAAEEQVRAASSAIFDANWALQQVQDPVAPESAALIREAAEGLIIARERLDVLRRAAFRAVIPDQEVSKLSNRVHAVANGLKGALLSGELERVDGQRNYLRVVTEHLAFPDRRQEIATFRERIAPLLAMGREEGFTIDAIPPAPPAMQLLLSGSYSPVRRGGYCWQNREKELCVEMAGPADLVADSVPDVVSPSADAELRFAWPPEPGSVKLWRLADGQEPVAVSVSPDLKFTLPEQSGTYLFRAEARWEPGSGTYAFKVRIK